MDIGPAVDGKYYLFRQKLFNNFVTDGSVIDVISYDTYSDRLIKVCDGIPLINYENKVYHISSHQFRHTVGTEMINAGVDIYAVKEFLGHSSVRMTEQYVKIYQERLKKEFREKLGHSQANDIISTLRNESDLFTTKWVKNKMIGVLELGNGCCEHPYKMVSCPHLSCLTCVKKKIYPRHIDAVKDTIESYTDNMNNAYEIGLNSKGEEFMKVVDFYRLALSVI